VICLTSAVILVGAGAFGELVYRLGDMREQEFSRLTQRLATGNWHRQEVVAQ
jgi:hypothetical protein